MKGVCVFLLSLLAEGTISVIIKETNCDGYLQELFIKYGVIPRIFPSGPCYPLKVCDSLAARRAFGFQVVWPSGAEARFGNSINALQLTQKPTVSYEGFGNRYSTLFIVGDNNAVPGVQFTSLPGQFLHWLVINIPGSDVSQGKEVAPYIQPLPPGPHRYVVGICAQQAPYEVKDPLSILTATARAVFFTKDFVEKYNLDCLVYGNLFFTDPGL